MRPKSLAVAVIALTGCAAPTTAVVAGRTVPRMDLGYTDHRYFAVNHEGAYPDVSQPPTRWHEYDGRIVGRVCALDINFESEYWGGRHDVTGFVTTTRPGGSSGDLAVRFDVRERPDGRDISGTFGALKIFPIDIKLRHDSIRADVGWRRFTLDQLDPEADELRGKVHLLTFFFGELELPFVIRGVHNLWNMPAADQAVVLPFMMSCLQGMPGAKRDLEPVLGIDFSGRADQPQPIGNAS
jgi:hypothetical protein